MENEHDQLDTYVMLQIAGWITAVLLQGERVLSVGEKHRGSDDRDPKARYRSIAEEEFFVVAARRLFRWLNEGKKRRLLGSMCLTELSKLERVVVDVRDMREHADDYVIRRRGKRQAKFHYSPRGTHAALGLMALSSSPIWRRRCINS